VILALAAGRRAAASIDEWLQQGSPETADIGHCTSV